MIEMSPGLISLEQLELSQKRQQRLEALDRVMTEFVAQERARRTGEEHGPLQLSAEDGRRLVIDACLVPSQAGNEVTRFAVSVDQPGENGQWIRTIYKLSCHNDSRGTHRGLSVYSHDVTDEVDLTARYRSEMDGLIGRIRHVGRELEETDARLKNWTLQALQDENIGSQLDRVDEEAGLLATVDGLQAELQKLEFTAKESFRLYSNKLSEMRRFRREIDGLLDSMGRTEAPVEQVSELEGWVMAVAGADTQR